MKNTTIIFKIICILSLILGMHQNLSARVAEQDSLALVALYNSTDGPNWTHNDNWLSRPVAEWYGITLFNNRVNRVDLTNNNLAGTIPTEIGDLTSLAALVLSENQLSGSIPTEIGNLVKLKTLNLAQNQLSGAIPPEIANLTVLASFFLDNNQLSGTIPAEIGGAVNLQRLSFSGNQLSGSIPIEIGNLVKLKTLNLAQNQLSGAIPPEIANLTVLASFFLDNNQLSGTIPAEIGGAVNLKRLSFSGNQLSGSIPIEIGNLTQLTNLYLSKNQLSGALPPEIGALTNLKQLWLKNNQLSDSLPREIGNLVQLREMHLDSNNLTGAVPGEIDSLKNLQRLYLDGNQFVDLPDVSPDTSLVFLSIAGNRFTFEDIEPNVWVENFNYSPQDSVGEAQDTIIDAGASLELSVTVGGSANQYQWTRGGVDIPGADSSSYTISAAESTDAGAYVCRVANTIAAKLTLYSRPINVAVTGGTGVADQAASFPKEFSLYQNYPNPFNPTTTIAFDVADPVQVELSVFDTLGRRVAVLVNQKYEPGYYSSKFDAGQLASGLYFYRIRMGDFQQTRKMLLVR